MKQFVLEPFFLLAAFSLVSCSQQDTGFTGVSKAQSQTISSSKAQTQPLSVPNVQENNASGAASGAASGSGKPACTKAANAMQLDASVPFHTDSVNGGDIKGSVQDVAESGVIKIPLNATNGDFLPVTPNSFQLDDVGFLVKPASSAKVDWDSAATTRTITIPSEAVFLTGGTDPTWAQGCLNSQANTVYVFQNPAQQVSIAGMAHGGECSPPTKLAELLRVHLVAYDNISIQSLKSLGFLDASGENIQFKIIHVAHGWGNLNLRFTLEPCQ